MIKADTERPRRRRKFALSSELEARAPPLAVRLLSKQEVLGITGVSFPTVWAWMRAGKFPRSRIVGGKSMWHLSEIEVWLARLPVRPLKGDSADSARARGTE
jgi:predicted DNA-binding transcriptional regulator AlpA